MYGLAVEPYAVASPPAAAPLEAVPAAALADVGIPGAVVDEGLGAVVAEVAVGVDVVACSAAALASPLSASFFSGCPLFPVVARRFDARTIFFYGARVCSCAGAGLSCVCTHVREECF